MLNETAIEYIYMKVLNAVSDYFSVTKKQIMRYDRRMNITHARMIVAYILREKFEISYPAIGRLLNGRDHTTILHAYRKISEGIKTDDQLRIDILKLINLISNSISKVLIDENTKIIDRIQDISPLKIIPKALTPEEKILDMPPLSKDKRERIEYIIKLWDAGWSLAKIGNRMQLTRERVRQIIEVGLNYEMQAILQNNESVDMKSYVAKRKTEHDIAISILHTEKRNQRKNIKNEEKRKRDRLREIRNMKWSRHYSKCGMCGTTEKPHRTNGYCTGCFARSPEHRESCRLAALRRKGKIKAYLKEYNQRPEVKARLRKFHNDTKFGGNREKALSRDAYKCTVCGILQDDAMKKYGRELYVKHLSDINDNSLDNLKSVCKDCFQRTHFQR